MAELVNQPTNKPVRKITAGGLAGALVTAVVGILGIELAAEVIAALTTITTFGVGYFVKERE